MSTKTLGSLLIYRCPFCQSTVEIGFDLVGSMVNCPNCTHPFSVEPPRAEVVAATRADQDEESVAEFRIEAPALDERTIRVVHPAVVRRRPLISLGLGAVAALAALGLALSVAKGLTVLALASLLVLLALAALLGLACVEAAFTTLTITNRRAIYETGIIVRRLSEVLLDDVRNLQVQQTFLERLLGIGDLAISSSGQDNLEIVAPSIPKPHEVVEMIQNQRRVTTPQ